MKFLFALTFICLSLHSFSQEDLSECFEDSKTRSYSSFVGINASKIVNGTLFLEYSRSFGDRYFFNIGGGPILFNGISLADKLFYPELEFDYKRGLELELSSGILLNNLETRYTEFITLGLFFNKRICGGDTSTQKRNAFGTCVSISYPIIGSWSVKSNSVLGFMTVNGTENQVSNNYYYYESNYYLYYYFGFSIIKNL